MLEFQGGRSSRDLYRTLGSAAKELKVYRTGPVLLTGEQLLHNLVALDGLVRGRLIGDGMGDGDELLIYRGSGVVMEESHGFLALMGEGVLNFSFNRDGLSLSRE